MMFVLPYVESDGIARACDIKTSLVLLWGDISRKMKGDMKKCL
jgi:hypothetical protein